MKISPFFILIPGVLMALLTQFPGQKINKTADFGGQVPVVWVDRVYPVIKDFIVFQNNVQTACLQIIVNNIAWAQCDSLSCEYHFAHGKCIVDPKVTIDFDMNRLSFFLKGPIFYRAKIGIKNAAEGLKVAGMFWYTCALEILGCGASDNPCGREAPCDQAGIRQFANTNRQIKTFIDDIDIAIR